MLGKTAGPVGKHQSVTAARALERLCGGAQPLEMESRECSAASRPMPAPPGRRAGPLLGRRGDPWPVATARLSQCSQCPLLFSGIRVTSVPCTEPGLPVQGAPSPCALPRDAAGLLMPNPRHQLLLSLL